MAPKILRPFSIFTKDVRLAVIIVNGRKNALPNIWKNFWNCSSLRGCTDGAAEKIRQDCLDGTLKWPTILSGDFDSISEETRTLFMDYSQVIETPDQDKTDLTKCLELVIQKDEITSHKVDAILILGGFSGRFDHTMATLNTMLTAYSLTSLPIFAMDAENLITVLAKGSYEIDIDLSNTTKICGVIPFCQEETLVTLDGFQWNLGTALLKCYRILDNAELKFGGLISTSNRIVSDKLKIETTAPVVLTIELLKFE